MRTSEIRIEGYSASGSRGPDNTYVVYMYEDQTLFEARQLPGKSMHYAESLATNWDESIGEFNIDK